MKPYEPTQLVAISRYQNYFPSLPTEIQDDVCARIRELIEEEKAYCDKGNTKHMAQILTSIAPNQDGGRCFSDIFSHDSKRNLPLTGNANSVNLWLDVANWKTEQRDATGQNRQPYQTDDCRAGGIS